MPVGIWLRNDALGPFDHALLDGPLRLRRSHEHTSDGSVMSRVELFLALGRAAMMRSPTTRKEAATSIPSEASLGRGEGRRGWGNRADRRCLLWPRSWAVWKIAGEPLFAGREEASKGSENDQLVHNDPNSRPGADAV